MSLRNEHELANTRWKLARLEARYEALRSESGGDEELRELTMESLKQTINQFKEEIARYECGASNGGRRGRMLQNDVEVANTRSKLRRLEERYEAVEKGADGDESQREAALTSLKRLINQLKEEIARYEAHQAVRR